MRASNRPMKLAKGKRVRPIPQRTCAACGETAGKRQLVRVVRGIDGKVAVDETGKKPGRGAYLCHRRSCWEQSLRKRSIERSLRVALTPESRALLEEYGCGLTDETSASESLGDM